ncbi:MAG: hypothetical protein M1833_002521 [Piccolia ochrophora]|nr:MAG: hypothetical protein M1833_002521 [Piccolia ochrophora]
MMSAPYSSLVGKRRTRDEAGLDEDRQAPAPAKRPKMTSAPPSGPVRKRRMRDEAGPDEQGQQAPVPAKRPKITSTPSGLVGKTRSRDEAGLDEENLPAPVPAKRPKITSTPSSDVVGKTQTGNEAGIENDEDLPAPAPAKRPKVAFHPDVQVQLMDDEEKSPEILQMEVRRAIQKRQMGDNTAYDRVREVFLMDAAEEGAPSPATKKNYLLAALSNISLLNKSCSGLVNAILESDWLGRDEAFIALFIRFLGILVSAQGSHLGPALATLVANLLRLPSSTGRLPGFPRVRRPQLYRRVHLALKYILQLIPSASRALSPIIASTFPPPDDTKEAYTTFVQNIIQLTTYTPELQSDVLNLITERLVKADVQIQVDLDDIEDDIGESLIQEVSRGKAGPSDDSDAAYDDSDTESNSSEESLDEEERRLKDLKSNVEKVDAILDILFKYYTPSFTKSSTDRMHIFDMLLRQFETTILPTYRCRHAGFLLFHFAQTSQFLIDRFVRACFLISSDKGRSSILKQSSAAFLASFVARGAHFPGQTVRDVFSMIGVQVDKMRALYEGDCRGPDIRRYGTFYAMVQALLYIFCFRWKDFMAEPDPYVEDDFPQLFERGDIIWFPGIKDVLIRTIESKLNPLKVCSPSIVDQFARVAHHVQLLYVYNIIEKNKRLYFNTAKSAATRSMWNHPERQTALTARKDDSHQQLDAYFPFDPYDLPLSKRWLDGDYVEWRGVPGLNEDEEDDAESESALGECE